MKLADYFVDLCSNINLVRKSNLNNEYLGERATNSDSPLTNDLPCDVELIDSIISYLKLGKVASLDELTSEHLKLCHPALALVLTKLFNSMLKYFLVPEILVTVLQSLYTRAITFAAKN